MQPFSFFNTKNLLTTTAPNPPTGVGVTYTTGNAYVTAAWTLATVTSDKPVSSYLVQFYYNTTSTWPSPLSSYTFGTLFTGLASSATSQNSTTPTIGNYYGAIVYSSNVIGSNSASNATLVQYGSAPSQPSIASLTSNTNSITVTWSVIDTTDTVASSYNVLDGINTASNAVAYSYSAPYYSFTMAETTSANYIFKVASVNAIGTTYSPVYNLTWSPTNPYAATSVTITSITGSGATTTWTAPTTGTPSSYTLLFYQATSLVKTNLNASSGTYYPYAFTNNTNYTALVVTLYNASVSASVLYSPPPTFTVTSKSIFDGSSSQGYTASVTPSLSAATSITFYFYAGDSSINTGNNSIIMNFNGKSSVTLSYSASCSVSRASINFSILNPYSGAPMGGINILVNTSATNPTAESGSFTIGSVADNTTIIFTVSDGGDTNTAGTFTLTIS
jgi:hypothetical protein